MTGGLVITGDKQRIGWSVGWGCVRQSAEEPFRREYPGLVHGRRCPTCHQDLADSPWCVCVPRPTWPCVDCGEMLVLGVRTLCRCDRREMEKRAAGSGPQRRLVKWAEEGADGPRLERLRERRPSLRYYTRLRHYTLVTFVARTTWRITTQIVAKG